MVDAHYTDPALAALYDALNPAGADTDFYVAFAGPAPITVVDLGCGTGVLARRLAAEGHVVIGIDPAPAMLDIARRNDLDGRVTWIEGDARVLRHERPVDLVILSGHAFQVLLTDDDITETLRATAAALAPNGRLAFETRNPRVRGWERWTPAWSTRRVGVDGIGQVEVFHALREVMEERRRTVVRFETSYTVIGIGDEVPIVGASTLRFTGADVLVELLRSAGFGEVVLYGNWDRSTITDSSPEIIAVATLGP